PTLNIILFSSSSPLKSSRRPNLVFSSENDRTTSCFDQLPAVPVTAATSELQQLQQQPDSNSSSWQQLQSAQTTASPPATAAPAKMAASASLLSFLRYNEDHQKQQQQHPGKNKQQRKLGQSKRGQQQWQNTTTPAKILRILSLLKTDLNRSVQVSLN
ncbi:hypothetical protein AABB24_009584, partial [Solanum stoloniferum]